MVLPRRSLGAMSLPSRFVDELNHINGVHINEEALSVDNPSRFSLEQKASPLQGAFPHNQRPCQKPVELRRADGCDTQAQHLVRSLRVPSGKIGDNGLNHWLRTRPHWLALGARRHPGISPTAAWPGGRARSLPRSGVLPAGRVQHGVWHSFRLGGRGAAALDQHSCAQPWRCGMHVCLRRAAPHR